MAKFEAEIETVAILWISFYYYFVQPSHPSTICNVCREWCESEAKIGVVLKLREAWGAELENV